MNDVAIRVEGLGKEYRLGAQQERYHTLGDQIRKWTSVRRLFSRAKRAEFRPPFWALKDVSFEVKRGEVVGIIGRNGAGKSTLLKILSRITEPTEGGADIHGRVGSLLEVGTGFHPELTGRENVFLNGAILGMRRAEIVRKFDEIVAFAEVEKFIDTPVKHYSSGMYMRLAFAVAAHLDPEILVVDEVLAVGDAQFQKKCLGKMGEVAKGGRTVLFVSHNMTAIHTLCTRAVLLRPGQPAKDGPVSDMISEYLADRKANTESLPGGSRPLGHGLTLEAFELEPLTPTGFEEVRVTFRILTETPVRVAHLALIVYSEIGLRVGVIDLRPRTPPYDITFDRSLEIICRSPSLRLVEGDYWIGLYLVTHSESIDIPDLYHFVVNSSPSEKFVPYPSIYRGFCEFDTINGIHSDP